MMVVQEAGRLRRAPRGEASVKLCYGPAVQHCRSHLLQQGPVLLACCSHRQRLLPQLQGLREGVLPPSSPCVLLGH